MRSPSAARPKKITSVGEKFSRGSRSWTRTTLSLS